MYNSKLRTNNNQLDLNTSNYINYFIKRKIFIYFTTVVAMAEM